MSFPTELLMPEYTGLCLYGAGFLGRNDGMYLREAGMKEVDIIDTDKEKIREMSPLFPDTWEYYGSPVETFLQVHEFLDKRWDVVCVDPPLALLDNDEITRWCRLAKQLVVVTVSDRYMQARRLAPGVLFSLENTKTWIVDRVSTRVPRTTHVVTLVPK